jgi:drug/metabolite transporter (DMT)-like permease
VARQAARGYGARAMGVVYGLLAALTWGTADFLARLASERVGSRRTIFYMQCLAALCLSGLLLATGARPPSPTLGHVLFAVVLGVLNVTGGSLLYRAMEIGTVSLVSPVSSTFAAISALLAIGIAGERPTPWQLVGLFLCAAGVIGASIPPRTETAAAPTRRGLGLAAAAAVVWGVSFFALRYVVGPLGALVPVWISRLSSIAALGTLAGVQRQPLPRPGGAWLLILGIAVTDSAAFIFYNLGVASQLTAVVSIISSLFSAVTVLLALLFLRERLSRAQWMAVGVIFLGVGLVSSAG